MNSAREELMRLPETVRVLHKVFASVGRRDLSDVFGKVSPVACKYQ